MITILSPCGNEPVAPHADENPTNQGFPPVLPIVRNRYRQFRMIRIVHIISNLEVGGAEMMLTQLVTGMDRGRFHNTVISLTDRGQLADRIESSGVAVHSLGMKRGRPDMASLPMIAGLKKTS